MLKDFKCGPGQSKLLVHCAQRFDCKGSFRGCARCAILRRATKARFSGRLRDADGAKGGMKPIHPDRSTRSDARTRTAKPLCSSDRKTPPRWTGRLAVELGRGVVDTTSASSETKFVAVIAKVVRSDCLQLSQNELYAPCRNSYGVKRRRYTDEAVKLRSGEKSPSDQSRVHSRGEAMLDHPESQ